MSAALGTGALVALGVVAASRPPGRPWHHVAGRATRGDRLRAVLHRVRTDLHRDDAADGPPPAEVIVTHVAALLRGGLPPVTAWQGVDGVLVGPDGIPDTDSLARRIGTAHPPGLRGLLARLTGAEAAPSDAARSQAAAVVAACRLAADVGAPLATVLESVVATLVAAAEASAERDAALAGPRTTARILLWLPAVGVVLGMALGADPLGLVLAGGPGAVGPVLGLVLLAVGRAWTRRLVDGARRAGAPG
ncbi:type II secretion system F family protein [Sanguibacter suaedae]|uniref:type II secretion system F family protein n=1 Tax=Sanguibacter suaedae TaxID=2795737 RepID=UPI001E520DD1|nr:hypothetical protein [Sanguibacter suaedae]